jgi:hypothetical protein
MVKKKKETTGVLVSVAPVTIKEKKYGGGLLDSDRQRYQEGNEVEEIDLTEGKIEAALADQEDILQREITEGKIEAALADQEDILQREITEGKIQAAEESEIEAKKLNLLDRFTNVFNKMIKPYPEPEGGIKGTEPQPSSISDLQQRSPKQEGGLLSPDAVPLPQETAPLPVEDIALPEEIAALSEETETLPEETALLPEEEMVPDEEMEDNYLDYVVSESLIPEEETYLMNKLEEDSKLSIIFDKVMDTALEFAGSGSVEGPGSEVSDSIPARLSDGEFVMTAKAADEIGPDNLQGMMSDAELKADQRQAAQEGGVIQPYSNYREEEEETDEFGRPISGEIRKGMLGVNPRLQPRR